MSSPTVDLVQHRRSLFLGQRLAIRMESALGETEEVCERLQEQARFLDSALHGANQQLALTGAQITVAVVFAKAFEAFEKGYGGSEHVSLWAAVCKAHDAFESALKPTAARPAAAGANR